MRSPNYPAVGLSEAVSMAQSIWNREKRSNLSPESVVQAWGYSGMSGVARTKIAAMKKYGLFDEDNEGDLRLSDRAMNILHNPLESPERLASLREAAFAPELFTDLQQTYPHASDETLKSYLITKKGFSDTGAGSCIGAFRDTQEIAKLNDMEPTPTASQSAFKPPPSPASGPSHNQQPQSTVNAPPLPQAETITTLRWPLAKGVVAEVRFIGPAKPSHLDLLKRYLDVAKDSMIDPDAPTEDSSEPPQ